MRSAEVDAWVRRLAEEGAAGNTNEDARVELKGEWPKPEDAAWRIGGHANAARGEPILWVIGLMPDGSIKPVKREDLANWWQQVLKHFDDGIAPTLIRDVVVTFEAGTVLALLFDTEAAPFVVKGGKHNHEIPYREGTRVDGARRRHLTRLLAPLAKLPTVDLVACTVTRDREPTLEGPRHVFRMVWRLFAAPAHPSEPAFLVAHRSRMTFRDDHSGREHGHAAALEFTPALDQTGVLVVSSPRLIDCFGTISTGQERTATRAIGQSARLSLLFAGAERPTIVEAPMRNVEVGHWTFDPAVARVGARVVD